MYGSRVWGTALKRKINSKLLRRIQRRILFRVISGYRTAGMLSRAHKKRILYGLLSVVFLLLLCYSYSPTYLSNGGHVNTPKTFISERDAMKPKYNRSTPLIFIGGMPRSGTTLFRVMLDAHPDIRCGEETRVVPALLSLSQPWFKSKAEAKRLREAGITRDILHDAIATFILEIITKHGKPAPLLCNKDPFTLTSAVQLHLMFPNAKFILLIRDGRAVVHSIISRQVGIVGFDITDYRKCLFQWNQGISNMYSQCLSLGFDICMPVYYEQLVLHPRQLMEDILQFLNVEWNELVLHHDQFVNKPGGISISKLERSSDQVIKPINLEALSKWVGQIPEDVVRDMENLAPMLAKLGYDPNANPPNYGKPDTFVQKNTYFLKKYEKQWAVKEQEIIQERQFFRSQYKRKEPNKNLNFSQ